jgi:hypothetical protein
VVGENDVCGAIAAIEVTALHLLFASPVNIHRIGKTKMPSRKPQARPGFRNGKHQRLVAGASAA